MTLPIITFIIAFAHRVLSGWQSMYLYQWINNKGGNMAVVSTAIIYAFTMLFLILLSSSQVMVIVVGILLGLPILVKALSFTYSGVRIMDIHLWENVVTGSFWLYLFLSGHDIVALCCSVYPSLLVHKGLINIGNDLEFFDERTDDETGKTYSIPFLNIKVPRTSFYMRVLFAAASIFILVMYCMSTLRFSLSII